MALACADLIAAGLAVAVSVSDAGGPARQPAGVRLRQVVPNALLGEFTKLDRKLDLSIEGKHHQLRHDTDSPLWDNLASLLKQFPQKLFGISFFDLFVGITAVRNDLADAAETLRFGTLEGRSEEDRKSARRNAIASLEVARSAKQDLEDTLPKAGEDRPGGDQARFRSRLRTFDQELSDLIQAARSPGKLSDDQLFKKILELQKQWGLIYRTTFKGRYIFGIPFLRVYEDLFGMRQTIVEGELALDADDRSEYGIAQLKEGRRLKRRLEDQLNPPAAAPTSPPTSSTVGSAVTISEDDTWTHNTELKKSRICINVRTTPPQTSVSGTVKGPDGYVADIPKSPLHADGTAQIRGSITQAGAYTKTLYVYDPGGKQTATVTKTFTVLDPPTDGPATTPPCPKPTS